MKIPGYGVQDGCVFAYDFGAGLTDGNLYRDLGPYNLGLSPVNFVAPNYGLAQGPSGATCLRFNGANQYGNLPLAFWAVSPTLSATFVVVARHATALNGQRIFFARSGAPFNGLELIVAPSARITLNGYSGGNLTGCVHTADVPLAGRTRVTILSSVASSAVRLFGGWVDGPGVAMTDVAAGAVVTWGTSPATVPNIGSAAGGNVWGGDLYFLGLWNYVFSNAEARALSAYWADRI